MKSLYQTTVKKTDNSLAQANVLSQPYLSNILTSNNTNVSDADTVTIGAVTYTFKTTINNSLANQVLIAGTADLSLGNLILAITAGSGSGTNYSTPTVAHPLVSSVSSIAAHAFTVSSHDNMTVAKVAASLTWTSAGFTGTSAMERAMDGAVAAQTGSVARNSSLITDVNLIATAGGLTPLSVFNIGARDASGALFSYTVLSNPNASAPTDAFGRALEAALAATGVGSIGASDAWVADVDIDNS